MSEEDKKLIGKRIKQLRETQGYTATDLASNLDIAEIELSKIEEGKFSLELRHILISVLRTLEHSLKRRCTEHRERLYLK